MDVLEKILINGEHEYECYVINYMDVMFDVILATEDVAGVLENLKDIQFIDIYDNAGFIRARVSDFTAFSSVQYIKGYRITNDGYLNAVQVSFEKVSLSAKVDELDKKVNVVVDVSSMSLEEYKTYRIKQLGEECRKLIYDGLTVETSNGKQHFTYNDDDQKNMKVLFDIAYSTKLSVPYHESGNVCMIYTWEDIVNIYVALQSNLLYQTTYCNALNTYIRKLSSKKDVASIVYGQEVSPELTEIMNAALAQGQSVMNALLAGCGLNSTPETDGDTVTE